MPGVWSVLYPVSLLALDKQRPWNPKGCATARTSRPASASSRSIRSHRGELICGAKVRVDRAQCDAGVADRDVEAAKAREGAVRPPPDLALLSDGHTDTDRADTEILRSGLGASISRRVTATTAPARARLPLPLPRSPLLPTVTRTRTPLARRLSRSSRHLPTWAVGHPTTSPALAPALGGDLLEPSDHVSRSVRRGRLIDRCRPGGVRCPHWRHSPRPW